MNNLVKIPRNSKIGLEEKTQLLLKSAVERHQNGQLESAHLAYEELLKIDPNNIIGLQLYGVLASQVNQFEVALNLLNRSVSLEPNYVDALLNRGTVLQNQQRYEEAIADFNRVITIQPNYAEAYFNRGNARRDMGQFEKALKDYNSALLLKPNYPDALANSARTLTELGQFQHALEIYNKVIAIDANRADAHRQISILKKYKTHDKQLLTMERLVKRNKLTSEEIAQLCYGLGKAYDDLGEYDKAFLYFQKGATLRKKLLNYDISKDEILFSMIKKRAKKLNNFSVVHPSTVITPIFIVGMPRSGTTLIEQILSSHSMVFGAGELPFWGIVCKKLIYENAVLQKNTIINIREQYLAALKKVTAKSLIVTDKMPHNFLYINFILKAFPEAKIIHCSRDPAAVCWSNYAHYFSTNGLGYSYDLKDLVSYYHMYNKLMKFWQKTYQPSIFDIKYENLVAAPQKEIRKLLQFIGLEYQIMCLYPEKNKRLVGTASQQQVMSPIYTGSSKKWKNYACFLEGHFKTLPKN
ncbi:MAG: sulfotransferase [bacterium]